MIYVYAIIESAEESLAPRVHVRGIDDCPVLLRPHGDLAMAFSRHTGVAPAPRPENIWRHEQVIESLMSELSLLPTRFGTLFSDEGAIDFVLERNRARLSEALRAVRGHVELGVRVLWSFAEPAAPNDTAASFSSGREYLLNRAAREQCQCEWRERVRRQGEPLHAELARWSTDSRHRVIVTPQPMFSGAYLVRRDRTAAFRTRVRELASAQAGLRILCTGPWPPYHFTPALELAEVSLA